MNNPANVISCPECNGDNYIDAIECGHCKSMIKSDREIKSILEVEESMKKYENDQKAKDINDLWNDYRKNIEKAWKVWEKTRNEILSRGVTVDPRLVEGYEEYERKAEEYWVDYRVARQKLK